ncbi:MAG: 1-deoxy-D-xylulose-5-phosphate synthase [Bacteroidales bacterium]|nr:1-deoxy-D-xylulose-5-phosphate synthase [Bacteroidales bacterium]
MYNLLDNIQSPADLRKLSTEQLEEVCAEIRDYMIKCCAVNPGHLGSSLGAVELITALHYVYNTPKDKIVFDVGHQAYAHKILTGRKEAFKGNRTKDGISGFPKMDESPYDAFGVGHSSTSVSAALGLAKAAKLQGEDKKVVAVIGDGAITGGMAFEGLNNAGAANSDLLIILNDNNQSIDSNLGALHEYLLRVTSGHSYNAIKRRIWNTVGEGKLRDFLQKVTKDTKSNLVRKTGGDLFESLGFRYFGPIDGNDLPTLVSTLKRLSRISGPRILHIMTKKGKGFTPAEEDPTTWHAPGKFNPETGERVPTHYPADRYQDVFGEVLIDLARKDPKIVGITPAMAYGCGMTAFAKEFPERFFDVGIEEEHAVTFSAGLAAGGMKPICNIYSSFSQRAYDQIIHDVALQNLPVVLCFDRGGLVGEDGATHHGCYDLAAYRAIPGVTISAPSDETELKNLMYSGSLSTGGPYIIRYPRGCGEGTPWREEEYRTIAPGKGRKIRDGKDISILVLGPFCRKALAAAERLSKEKGIEAAVYDMRFLKPIDTTILEEAASSRYGLLTVEEGSIKGGLYGEVTEYFAPRKNSIPVHGIGIPDRFITQDRQSAQRKECGLDEDGIYDHLVIMASEDPQ